MRLCECGCGQPVSERAKFAHGHYLGNGRVRVEQYSPKGCECGCGELAPIATVTRRGYRKGQPMRFIQGHAARTAVVPPPPVRRGEANNKWRGNEVSYQDLHRYLLNNFPKTGICDECGAHKLTEHANIHGRGYTRNREDYRELCKSCHSQYDAPWIERQRDSAGRWV